jgi:hypothetical protein
MPRQGNRGRHRAPRPWQETVAAEDAVSEPEQLVEREGKGRKREKAKASA